VLTPREQLVEACT